MRRYLPPGRAPRAGIPLGAARAAARDLARGAAAIALTAGLVALAAAEGRAPPSAAAPAGVNAPSGAPAASGETPFGAAPLATPDAAESARLAALRKKIAEAYGGEEAVLAFRGFHARGEIVSVADGLAGRVQLDVKLDGSMRSEVRYAPRWEIELAAGPLAWRGGRAKLSPATGDARDSIRLHYHRLAAPFEILAAAPEDLRLESGDEAQRAESAGRTRLVRRWGERLEMIYEVDAESGLVRRTIGRGGANRGVFVTTDVTDHRPVDGPQGAVLVAHRASVRIGDRLAAEIVLDRVEERGEFPAGTFLSQDAEGEF